MRIPLTKVYRAFPELDQFTDEQCRGYEARARAKRQTSKAFFATIGVICSILILILGFAGVNEIEYWLLGPFSPWRVWILRHFLDVPLEYVDKVIPFIAVGIVGLMTRDVWLRRAIRLELNRTTCPRCEYQLLGLPVSNGLVGCPECGQKTRLDLLGLRPEDLAMPDPMAEHSTLAS
jgi:hypothetical protein